jgi:hypothetical protein
MSDPAESLIARLVSGGAIIPSNGALELGVSPYTGVRGVMVKTHIPSGNFLRIPFKCLLSVEKLHSNDPEWNISDNCRDFCNSVINSKRFSSGNAFEERILDNLDHIVLAIMILDEADRAKESFWFEYISLLPSLQDFDCLPVNWDTQDLELLRGSFVYSETLIRKERYDFQYRTLCELSTRSFDFQSRFSFERYLWAIHCVGTRVYAFKRESDGKLVYGMNPFSDLINHFKPPRVTWTFHQAKEMFVMNSEYAFDQGEEVLQSYGTKSNSTLLLEYGFTLPANPCKSVELLLQFDPQDPLYNRKVELWGSSHVFASLSNDLSQPSSHSILGFLRLKVATASELLEETSDSLGSKVVNVLPFNSKNEARMLSELESELEAYRKPISQRQSDLKENAASREKLCHSILEDEAEVCEFFIEMAKNCRILFSLPWMEYQPRKIKFVQDFPECAIYIASIPR